MSTKWRISSFSGVLLAAYFIPTWVLIAYRIMVSPVQGFFERPNVSAAFFVGDYLQLASTGTVRAAWLLALGRLTVAGFFAVFLVLVSLPRVRKAGGCNEALAIALAIGSVISFALMLMASHVGEVQALRLHATELLMLLGTAIIFIIEGPVQSQAKLDANVGVGPLAPEQTQLLNNS